MPRSALPPPRAGRALAVVGTAGGCGATTLAAVLAALGGRGGWSCCAVDLQPGGGGLDVPFAVEHLPGLRWSDLAEVDGPVDGPALASRLPAAGSVRILAHSREAGSVPGPEAQVEVIEGLRAASSLLVADLPRAVPQKVLETFDVVVLLGGDGVLELAALAATARRLSAAVDDMVLVLRRRRRSRVVGEELSRGLGLSLVGWLPDERRVQRNLRRGLGPVTDGPLARLAADLVKIVAAVPARVGA